MKIEDEISQKKFRNEFQKASVNILYTSSWLELQLKDLMKSHGITLQQYNVLRILKGQHPNPVSTNTIRDRMLDKMSDVSRIISRLQAKKVVEVKKALHDKRLVDIIITQRGIDLINAIDGRNSEIDGILGRNLSEAEAAQLSDLLDKIRQ